MINLVKDRIEDGRRLLVSTSYGGGTIPEPDVVAASDYLLLHGNGVSNPEIITKMIQQTKAVEGCRSVPIVFNEDDHYDFDQQNNNMVSAVRSHASWGFFDFRREGEGFNEGYQSMPADWGINSDRKKSFFNLVKEMTSNEQSNIE